MSGASERANKRASGLVLQSGFLVFLDHSGREKERNQREERQGEKREMIEKDR